MRRAFWGVVIVSGLLYLLTGVVQVRRGERAVVRRFGRVLDEKPTPGLWVGLPWGMDRVDRIEVDTVRNVEVGQAERTSEDDFVVPPGQLLTGDHNLVNVQAVLYYKVRPEEVADFAVSADRAPSVLRKAVEAIMSEWAASREVDVVLLQGKTRLRAELLARLPERIAHYGLGVLVWDVRVSRLAPPDEVRADFEAVATAQTRMATLRYRAEQEAASRLRTAEADVDRARQTALASAYSKREMAEQEAALFRDRLKLYHDARTKMPDYLRLLWQEERGKILSKLKEDGRIDLLDDRLSGGVLELFTAPRVPKP